MRQRLQGLQVIKAQLETLPDRQISQTDPDARAMTTYSAKGTAMVGYNVQAAVDTKNHLIVAHDRTRRLPTGEFVQQSSVDVRLCLSAIERCHHLANDSSTESRDADHEDQPDDHRTPRTCSRKITLQPND